MDACREGNHRARGNGLVGRRVVRDEQVLTRVAGDGCAEQFTPQERGARRVRLEHAEIATELGVRVGVAVSKVDPFLIQLARAPHKRQCGVLAAAARPLDDPVLKVEDPLSTAPPPLPVLGGGSRRVDQRSHPLPVKGLRLAKVDDVEAVGAACLGAAHGEEVPLRVAASAVVPVQEQIVLVNSGAVLGHRPLHVDRATQVAALEARLKEQPAARNAAA
mmetsp:Transcript_3060/g.8726  ORF Transcript_3060/g.8726 Transcript_3060/m.8726 type:complete len:219 (-) Transcript_3060:42-698(-)